MNKKCITKYFQALLCLLFALLCHPAYAPAASEPDPVQITMPAPDSPQAQKYLGLKDAEPFALSKLNAKIVVIEFFNALCPHCHSNAPIVNKLYKVVQDDSGLRDVKFIGVAIGSDKSEVEAFRKNFKVPFPIFIDENFAISAAVEGVDTPTTIVLGTSNGKVYARHVGVIKDFDGFLKELRAIHKKL
jgi:thiol-disulfide isomerase/thioredoxin